MVQKYPLPTSGYYLWRAVSRDGFAWTEVGVVQAEYGGESAFLFEPDGSLLAIVRSRAAALPARLCRAGAPHRGMDRARSGPQHRRPATRSMGLQPSGRRQEGQPPGPRRDGALLARRRSDAGRGRASLPPGSAHLALSSRLRGPSAPRIMSRQEQRGASAWNSPCMKLKRVVFPSS